jgi:signal transduction histidine kinase
LAFNIVLDSLDGQIRACGATVTGENLPRVKVSLERLTQMLEHLIGNSLKFRGEAAPVVHISAQAEADGWTIQVQDNGSGVDPMDCEAIFRPFARIHGRKYPGAGLGLSVCRRIVEAHGGTIRMSPHAPVGSVCTLWLPAV